MILIQHGFTPRQIDEEFAWRDIEQFIAILPQLLSYEYFQE